MTTIRWGMIGCGDVAEVKSGPGFQKAAGSALVATAKSEKSVIEIAAPFEESRIAGAARGQWRTEPHVCCFVGDRGPRPFNRSGRCVGRTALAFGAAALWAVGGSGGAHAAARPRRHPAPASATAPAPAPAPAAAPDPAPGALPQERNHLLEAQWGEVRVKARKEGKEVVAAVKLVAPKIRLFHAAPPPDDNPDAKSQAKSDPDAGKKAAPKPPAEVIDLAAELRKITPTDVDHIDILDGQVAFIDTSRPERPELWIHELQLSVENLTTRVHLGDGRPVLLTASGVLARSGSVSIFITADPFEKGLTFSGRAAVVGLQTAELYRFIEPATKMQAPHGTIDIFVEFDCRNGELTGGIKPLLKNVEIRPSQKNFFTVLKAWAADLTVKIFSDRVPQRNAVATVIPIKGTLNSPDIQLWPTIFGIMRNAFVEGLTAGYAHLPPVTAPEKQGVVKQGVDSLAGSGPPKAQPTEHPDHAPVPAAPPPPGPAPAPGPGP